MAWKLPLPRQVDKGRKHRPDLVHRHQNVRGIWSKKLVGRRLRGREGANGALISDGAESNTVVHPWF